MVGRAGCETTTNGLKALRLIAQSGIFLAGSGHPVHRPAADPAGDVLDAAVIQQGAVLF